MAVVDGGAERKLESGQEVGFLSCDGPSCMAAGADRNAVPAPAGGTGCEAVPPGSAAGAGSNEGGDPATLAARAAARSLRLV